MTETESSRSSIQTGTVVGVWLAVAVLLSTPTRGETPRGEESAGIMGAVERTDASSVPGGGERTATEASFTPPPRVLRDAGGEPLALDREADVLTFLRQARVVDSRPLDVGVTGADILTLELGGIRVRGVFHDIDVQKTGPIRLADGTVQMYFVDSYRSQVAAYELARSMGLDRVPPTVQRTVEGERGSIQLWIEDGTDWREIQEEDPVVPNHTFLRRQMDDMRVFDNLIHNTDRNQGNILFDPDWNLWWIDHTRAFARFKELVAPELVERCSRELWQALNALDEGVAREALRSVLTVHQINALLTRRDRLVKLLEQKIAERGEARVLFDYGDPPTEAVRVTYEEVGSDP